MENRPLGVSSPASAQGFSGPAGQERTRQVDKVALIWAISVVTVVAVVTILAEIGGTLAERNRPFAWNRYEFPSHHFAIELPGKPVVTSKTLGNGDRYTLYSVERGKLSFGVGYNAAAKPVPLGNPEAFLDAVQGGAVRSIEGTVRFSRPYSVPGLFGREFGAAGHYEGVQQLVFARILAAPTYYHVVMVSGPPDISEPVAYRFLNSFRTID